MKFEKVLYAVSWCITFIGLILFFAFEQNWWLLLVFAGLATAALLKYRQLKQTDDQTYLNMRTVFMYIIGALASLFVFALELHR